MSKYKLQMTFTVPNILSFFRLTLTPFFVVALSDGNYLVGLIIFTIAGITDTLDGLAARSWGMKTRLGEFLDPMADKILLTAAFVTLSIHLPNGEFVIPLWLTILVISRDVSIVLVALLIHVVTGRKNFQPSIWGKISTTLLVSTVFAVLLSHVYHPVHVILLPLYLLTFTFTLISGLLYIFATAHSIEITEDE